MECFLGLGATTEFKKSSCLLTVFYCQYSRWQHGHVFNRDVPRWFPNLSHQTSLKWNQWHFEKMLFQDIWSSSLRIYEKSTLILTHSLWPCIYILKAIFWSKLPTNFNLLIDPPLCLYVAQGKETRYILTVSETVSYRIRHRSTRVRVKRTHLRSCNH